jgi:hypothetical protein
MQQPHFSRTAGWFTLVALLVFSPQLAGCDSTPKSPDLGQKSGHSVGQAVIRTPEEGKVDARLEEVPKKKLDEATEGKATPEKIAEAAVKDLPGEAEVAPPQVKRLVIASDIDKREPIELLEGKVSQPIVAFVELTHKGAQESGVVVTFESEKGTKVGFVQLNVPAESPRYRTWARTRNIREPGTWTAIVSTESGEELARKTFTVTS